ncbi:MAG TPA: RagB/SusD family nutrient uptake outer membrane protein [Bacteroidales bacterium]|nr:RagB/SusD family nutrient uptake outer membrane protein [Bacteroidales bacterium]
MKFNAKIRVPLLLIPMTLFLTLSCQDMLETSSSRIAFEEANQLKSSTDLFYSISGILSQVQKIGDKYVLFGELRGDLMTVSENSPLSLKEINQFQITSGNEFLDKHDYYSVINNCNFALQRMDTALVIQNEKVMLPAYVEIKTIRAWTYFQLAQIFGNAVYFQDPMLDMNASGMQQEVLSLDELVSRLINDLEPFANVPLPSSNVSPNNFVPVQILLGDLFLYQNNYEKAAEQYYNYIQTHAVVLTADYASRWTSTTFDDVFNNHRDSYLNEAISSIQYNTDPRGLHSSLVSLSYNDKASILPTKNFVDFMSLAPHFFADKLGNAITATTEGDLRGNISFSKKKLQYGDAYSFESTTESNSLRLIYKYFYRANESNSGSDPSNQFIPNKLVYQTQLPVYRIPHLYLRYLEAVNRSGKPSLAFSGLKYGLTSSTISNPAFVNPAEVGGGESYLNFQNAVFDQNVPIAARGRGYGIPKDTKVYVIPNFTKYLDGVDTNGKPVKIPSVDVSDIQAAHQDSIEWVELRILDEMAAETSFEGNRFFDLLRISHHRNNHPTLMAEKVSAKFEDALSMKSKLMDINAWFVK